MSEKLITLIGGKILKECFCANENDQVCCFPITMQAIHVTELSEDDYLEDTAYSCTGKRMAAVIA